MSEADLFADFVRANAGALARTAYLLTGNHAGAEDLVQDTLVRLFRYRSALLAAEAPLAYARRALTNQFLNDRRKRSSSELILERVPDRAPVPDFSGEVAERERMWALLDVLVPKQRAAIVLRYYHDLSDADIGAALGCRPGTVRSLISRGLAALRVSTPEGGGGR